MSYVPSVGQTAFASSLAFAATAIGAGVAAAGTTSAVATVALTALAMGTAGAGIAAGAAYFATEHDDLNEYFDHFKKFATVFISVEAQIFAQRVLHALENGFSRAISRAVDRKMSAWIG